jgi:hypothetical protein
MKLRRKEYTAGSRIVISASTMKLGGEREGVRKMKV